MYHAVQYIKHHTHTDTGFAGIENDGPPNNNAHIFCLPENAGPEYNRPNLKLIWRFCAGIFCFPVTKQCVKTLNSNQNTFHWSW